MKKIILLSLSILVLYSCTENNNESKHSNKDKVEQIDSVTSNISIKDSVNAFYASYAELVRFPMKDSVSFYSKRINQTWCFLLSEQFNVIDYLIEVNEAGNVSIYGERFNELLPNISKLPNNVHTLFWIEALYQKDYLFNRRLQMGLNPILYIQNPVSVFPVFQNENENSLFFEKEEIYEYSTIMKVRPDFYNSWYTSKVDSVLNKYSDSFKETGKIKETGIDWYNYENIYEANKFTKGLLPSYLGNCKDTLK